MKKRGILVKHLEPYTYTYFIVFGLIEMSKMADMCVLCFKFMVMETAYPEKCWKNTSFFPFKG